MKLRDLFAKGLRSTMVDSHSGGLFFRYGSTGFNWRAEAGDVHSNGAAATGLQAILDLLDQTSIGAFKDVKGSLGTQMLDARADLSARKLLESSPFGAKGTIGILAASLKLYGPALIYVEKDKGGKPLGLTPFMQPQFQGVVEDGVQKWRVSRHGDSGKTEVLDGKDCILLGWGSPDPRNPLVRISPLQARLRSVCSANESETYLASVLRNAGIPGVIISPKESGKGTSSGGDGGNGSTTPAVKEKILTDWKMFTRDRRGEPHVIGTPVDITNVAFSPDQMKVIETSKLSETVILASLGVDAKACGLPSDSSTYANFGEARKALVQDTVLPLGAVICQAIEDILRKSGIWAGVGPEVHLALDASAYPQLQMNKLEEQKEAREHFKAGGLTRGEYRQQIGLLTETSDKRLFQQINLEFSPQSVSVKSALERARIERLHDLTDSDD